MRRVSFGIGLCVVLWVLPTLAVPSLVHYRGFLSDLDGLPIHCPDAIECPGGPFSMTLHLYGFKEGGESLWTQSYDDVSLRDGVFDLALGDEPEGSSFYEALALTDSLYLGVSINGGPELVPRQRLAASAWAIVAGDAQRLGGVVASSYALQGELSAVAWSGDYKDLTNTPALEGEGGGSGSSDWNDLTGVPAGFGDGIDDETMDSTCVGPMDEALVEDFMSVMTWE